MEEILKQILAENQKMSGDIQKISGENQKMSEEIQRFAASQSQVIGHLAKIEKTQRSMAKDIKDIKDYERIGLDVDIEKLQERVTKVEQYLKIV